MSFRKEIAKTIKVMLGILLAGIGTAILYELGWGSNPSATMIEGLSVFFNLNYGVSGIIINMIFILMLLLFDRKLIGVETVLITFFFGYFIEAGVILLSPFGIAEMNMTIKSIMLVIGCVLTAIGLGYYVGQFYGTGTMDAMSVIFAEKCHIKFSYCRWGLDILMMVSGVFMGASWGAGTIGSIIVTAPIMEIIIHKLKEKEPAEVLVEQTLS